MAIIVVCKECHARFKVSDQFAGKKGPCPKCKATIYVPKPEEQVKVHAPEHSEEGARGRGGELVLKPIEREETKLPIWVIGTIAGTALLILIAAYVLRGASDAVKFWAAGIGAILVGPPLSLAGYAFLRNDELEPYSGLWLWVRTGICATVYALCWGVFSLLPVEWTDELWKWAFLGPAFGVVGATASFACFDLDFGSGFFHFAFYVGVTALLGLTMGMKFVGG